MKPLDVAASKGSGIKPLRDLHVAYYLVDLSNSCQLILGTTTYPFPREGETILPPSSFGPVCRFNAEGKEVVHKDQPMETAYRQVEWTWEQWSGRYDTETMSKIVDVPYKRYPR